MDRNRIILLLLILPALALAQPRFTWPQLPAGTAAGQIARTGASPYNGTWTDGKAWVDSILYARGTVYGSGTATYLAEWLNDSTLQSDATGAYLTSVGTTAQRPAGTVGLFRYNTDEGELEFYGPNTAWWGVVRSSDYSLTSGSVPYVGSNGGLLENNSAFYWDNSNVRLGINTNNPQKKLHVIGSGANGGVLFNGPTSASTASAYDQVRYQADGSFRQVWYNNITSGNVPWVYWKFYSNLSSKQTRWGIQDGDGVVTIEINPVSGQSLYGTNESGVNGTGDYTTSSYGGSKFSVFHSWAKEGALTVMYPVIAEVSTRVDSTAKTASYIPFRNFESRVLLQNKLGNHYYWGAISAALNIEDTDYDPIAMLFTGRVEDSTKIQINRDGNIKTIGGLVLGATAVAAADGGRLLTETLARTLTVNGEARITDLTTDAPTRIIGADADGDIAEITTGANGYVARWTSTTIIGTGALQDDGTTVSADDGNTATAKPIRFDTWTTAARPTGSDGKTGYNSTTGLPEMYYNSTWNSLSGADGNGIYGGSGSLTGNTTVTAGSYYVDFNGTTTTPLKATATDAQAQTVTNASTSYSALAVTNNPSSTNTTVAVLDVKRTTSGTAAAGLGAATDHYLENASAANVNAMRSAVSWVTPTAGATDAQWKLSLQNGGSLTERISLSNAGVLTLSGAHIVMGSGGPKFLTGSGSPESVVTAVVGSLYLRTDGGASTTLYVKESGTGNTGWVGK